MNHFLFLLLCFSIFTIKNVSSCGFEKDEQNKEMTFFALSKIHQTIKNLPEPDIDEDVYPLTFDKKSLLGEKSLFKIITFYTHYTNEDFSIYISEKSLPKFMKLYEQEKISRLDTKDFTYINTESIKHSNTKTLKKFLIFTLDPNHKTVMFVDMNLLLLTNNDNNLKRKPNYSNHKKKTNSII